MKSDPPPALWQTISQHWQSIGIANPPGATDADIDAFERTHGVRLPAENREFYSHVDGMSLGAWDESLIRFWPLSEWNPVTVLLPVCRGIPDYGGIENSLPDAGSYFVFADHSIWIHVYAVRLTSDPTAACPVVNISGGDHWGVQSASFAEFLQAYAKDSWDVIVPFSPQVSHPP